MKPVLGDTHAGRHLADALQNQTLDLEKIIQARYKSHCSTIDRKGQRMPGFQEIFIISIIVAGVVFIPRMMESKRPAPRLVRVRKSLSGRRRLAIALSIVYPLAAAAAMQPWRKNPTAYAYIGLGPVLLGWLLHWVLQGFRRK
jgi:hypothetical protein